MKKMWRVLVVCLCLFLLSGCQGNNTPEVNNEDPQDELVYLDGYPDDVVPLLRPVFVDSNRFSVRDDLNYVIGKDLYSIYFESAADMDELSEYYRELMDDLDEESSYSDYVFEGQIQGRRVNVMISELGRDNALGTAISLSVGMPRDEYVDENPYFADYPEGIIEVFGFYKLQEYTYSEDYSYNYARYATIYQTQEEAEDITTFYREKYKDMPGFTETQENNGTVFNWEDDSYRCMVRYDANPNIQFLQLLVDKDL